MSTRPIGDITTLLDLVSRDSQDDYFFPEDTKNSQFNAENEIYHPTANNVYEIVHKGTADWGGRLTFELDSLSAGDMLQGLILQIRLGHWYNARTISNLLKGNWIYAGPDGSGNQAWTYVNSLGTCLIEYAEFEVGDQTIERITGEYIQTHLSLNTTASSLIGVTIDGLGRGTIADLATQNTEHGFTPNRPWPTQDGQYYCILPFFFMRNRYSEAFPLLSCAEGSVRVHVKLRPFNEMVRACWSKDFPTNTFINQRTSCTDTPLNSEVTFITDISDSILTTTQPTAQYPPPFEDFRIVATTTLCTGNIRSKYLRSPFSNLTQFVQLFKFDEPLKYLVSKTNPNQDYVDIQIPLELNHPTKEIVWVFRRKAALINNEWWNFSPEVETQWALGREIRPWLRHATLRVNGQIVENADGEWWRWNIANKHRGGIVSYSNHVYGYSFARYPDDHQPSGFANMSRAHSVTLNMSVNVPIPVVPPPGFDIVTAQGWELHLYAVHYNWLRFQNGMCQKVYAD
jgi:hypothetical protein